MVMSSLHLPNPRDSGSFRYSYPFSSAWVSISAALSFFRIEAHPNERTQLRGKREIAEFSLSFDYASSCTHETQDNTLLFR